MSKARPGKLPGQAPCILIAKRDAALLEKRRTINGLLHAKQELEIFAYSVAHDLRAPLRTIDGFSAILERDDTAKLNDGARVHLRYIRDGVKRMQNLLDTLLDLSRSDCLHLQRQPLDLAELAQLVLAGLRQGEPERQVEFAVAEQLPVDGDQRLLRLLMENILGNAWKYTGERRVGLIEFGFDPQEMAYVVRDNGVGFDMVYADKLFRPFQRLHSTAQFAGTGLGLCIVKRIVERHGGRVWIESAKGRGTAVYFTLNETAPLARRPGRPWKDRLPMVA